MLCVFFLGGYKPGDKRLHIPGVLQWWKGLIWAEAALSPGGESRSKRWSKYTYYQI
jgi:hypothetical protein